MSPMEQTRVSGIRVGNGRVAHIAVTTWPEDLLAHFRQGGGRVSDEITCFTSVDGRSLSAMTGPACTWCTNIIEDARSLCSQSKRDVEHVYDTGKCAYCERPFADSKRWPSLQITEVGIIKTYLCGWICAQLYAEREAQERRSQTHPA